MTYQDSARAVDDSGDGVPGLFASMPGDQHKLIWTLFTIGPYWRPNGVQSPRLSRPRFVCPLRAGFSATCATAQGPPPQKGLHHKFEKNLSVYKLSFAMLRNNKSTNNRQFETMHNSTLSGQVGWRGDILSVSSADSARSIIMFTPCYS
jgi:hypothetical protein